MRFVLPLCWALVHSYPDVIIPSITLADLISSTSKKVSSLLNEMSMVSVTKIPGLSQARQDMFAALSVCHIAHPQTFEHSSLDDGTKRAALATEAKDRQIPEFAPSVVKSCPHFTQATRTFRSIISEVSGAFASSMDASEKGAKAPFRTALEHGQQLEHFIVYKSPLAQESDLNKTEEILSIDMHVDEGLFIALVPPMLISQTNNAQSGLIVKLKSGELRNVIFQDESSLVFMVGDGLTRWMQTSNALTAVPHALKMESDLTRLWYGRMFLPPPSQFSSQIGLTFGMYRELLLADSPQAMVGCFAGKKDIKASQCNGTDFACWMRCYTQEELPFCDPDKIMECISGTTGLPCAPDQHSCGPKCQDAPPVPFCDPTYAMTMFMDGFASPQDGQACVIFLFRGWVMDTRVKFFFGCMGAIALGLLAEFLISIRRGMTQWERFTAAQLKGLELFFYICQATMGYILMLLAMTYSVPIFFCVLIGLALGHLVFVSRKSAVVASESGTPCCEGVEHQMVFNKDKGYYS